VKKSTPYWEKSSTPYWEKKSTPYWDKISTNYWKKNFTPLDTGCVCINPFLGKDSDVKVNGDPDDMCRQINMCYVDCNSTCRDVQNAKGFGRCYSNLACKDHGNNEKPVPTADP